MNKETREFIYLFIILLLLLFSTWQDVALYKVEKTGWSFAVIIIDIAIIMIVNNQLRKTFKHD